MADNKERLAASTNVVSLNLHRRHLSSSQRAALAIEILPMLEAEAKERMQAGGEVRQQGKERIPYPEEKKGHLTSSG